MKVTVKQARVGAGLTQEEMAKRLHVSTPTYGAWERNPGRMRYSIMCQVAAITGIEVSDLNMEASG